MIIDIGFLLLMVYAIYKGISKGFIVAVFSFFAFYIGLAAALKLSSTVAKYLQEKLVMSSYWLPLLSFFLVFAGVVVVVRIGASMLKKISGLILLGWLDSVAGIFLFALLYLMIYSVMLFYATRMTLIDEQTQQASATYFFIQPLGPRVIDLMGKAMPFFSNMFDQLSAFFEQTAKPAIPTDG